jgi:DNA-binding MarR family transcriptional regulator
MGVPLRSRRLTGLFFALKRSLHERLKRSGALKASYLPRMAVLGLARETGGATMKDVAAFLGVSPPSVTGLVGAIADDGLLTRNPDPGDRRTVRLRLTPKGEKALDAGMRRMESVSAHMFKRLTPAEQDRLITLLEKLLV